MNTQKIISSILHSAALSYRTSIVQLDPWGGNPRNNVITERNISFQVVRAFTNCMAHGIAFMERPFLRSFVKGVAVAKPVACHLDAYCLSPELAVLLEVKTFFDRPEIVGIFEDMDRVDSKYPNQQQQCHPKIIPSETRGLVIVETWKKHNLDWWVQSTKPGDDYGFHPDWTSNLLDYKRAGWTFDIVFVGTFPAGPQRELKDCHWLYCFSPLADNLAANQDLAIRNT